MDLDFETWTQPYRGELLALCYRMMGSIHDAEDLLQETLVRAWRAADRYDSRKASVRTWLYRIATNSCLTALETKRRRPLPVGLGGPSDDPEATLIADLDVPWLEPFPDHRLGDPAAIADGRESLGLAFVAALQELSARQRAVLILREVLQWSAAEVAECLDVSVPAVNSALQRARSTLRATPPVEDRLSWPADGQARRTLEAYVDAFQRADLDGLTALLRADVVLEMPPVPTWYAGVDHYRQFMARVHAIRGRWWRALPVAANGQPAFAAYALGADGAFHAHTLQVLTVHDGAIVHNVVFADPRLFSAFDLPASLPTE